MYLCVYMSVFMYVCVHTHVFVWVYVSAYTCMCICECVCVYTCMWGFSLLCTNSCRPEVNTGIFHHFPTSCFWDRTSFGTWSSLFWLDWLARESLGSACLQPPVLGFQACPVVPGGVCMSSGNLNSHPHVSTATTLPTETSPCTLPQKEFNFMLYMTWFEFFLGQVCVLKWHS